MANPPRIRKRINAFLRAPDGSAFNKCEHCGVSFPIALSDMHECEGTRNAEKKRRVGSGEDGFCSDGKTRIVDDQPRSAFCFFMESCRKNYENENWIEIDRKGFQLWKELSSKGRLPFEVKADRVNSAYQRVLLDEVDGESEVDDEADSSMVGKHYPDYLDPNYMDRVLWPCDKFSSFDSDDWSCSS